MYWIQYFLLLGNLLVFMCEGLNTPNGENVFRTKKYMTQLDFDKFDLSVSIFSSVEDYQVDAREMPDSEYPWIARVIHSKANDYPHVCTCSCIDEFIFITSARCLTILRVQYTRIIYKGHKFPVKAFVTPAKRTKQSYDDIGFLVVKTDTGYDGKWDTVKLYDQNRTDDSWQWFSNFLKTEGNGDHKAIGFALRKRKNRIKAAESKFQLSELEVVLGMELCAEIYTASYRLKGFYVPCYFGCELEEFRQNSTRCSRAHGVEGGAVYNAKTNKLFGVTTWGSFYAKHELPWGFSIPNSNNFFIDRDCAIKIRDDKKEDVEPGYLQSLCPND